MKFSQRIGKTPTSKGIQLESIDEDLKNGLWNIFDLHIIREIETGLRERFSHSVWHHFFKKPLDKIPSDFKDVILTVRDYFFNCQWFELYDLIEFTVDLVCNSRLDNYIDIEELCKKFNCILEREFAGYRLVNEKICPITNETEINEIEKAINQTQAFTPLKGCNTHLKMALSKLSDRKKPDYRNSIKESVSAIESIAKVISNNPKGSLRSSLDKIKGKLKIHPALEGGFKQIYGYTSDSDGIRHALMDEANCEFEDAQFMLVSCSAFVNYLIAKGNKAGVIF